MISTDGLDLLDSLGSLADLAGRSTDLGEVLERAVSMVAEATGAELCVVAHPPAADNGPAPILAISPTRGAPTSAVALATWMGPIAARVRDANQPLLIQTPDAADAELRAMLAELGLASAVAAPIVFEDEPAFVLAAFSSQPNGFANVDLGFMSSLANVLSLARKLHDRSRSEAHDGTAANDSHREASEPESPRAHSMAGLGGWELNLSTGDLFWTDSAYEIFGFDPAETTPTQELFDSLVDQRDRERLRNSLRESRFTGQKGTIEYRIRRADGVTRWLREQHELQEEGSEHPCMVGTIWDVTLQREASETMRRTDERLRAVLNVSEIGIAVVEGDGGSVYRNRAYTDLLGYDNEEMEQRRLEDCAIPSDRGLLTELRHRLSHGETHVSADRPITFVRPDGSEVQLAVSVSQTEVGDRSVQVVNLRDVTTEVEARVNLTEEHRQLVDRQQRDAVAQRLGHFGYWDRELGSDVLHWTSEVFRIFGLDEEAVEPSGSRFYELVHPDDRATVRETVQRALDSGERYTLRHRIVRPDGVVRTVDESGELVRGEDGAPLLLVGLVHDVTELVAVEQALQQSETHLRGMLDASQNAILLVGPGTTIEFRNRAFAEMLGYGADEVEQVPLTKLAVPESVEQIRAAVYAVSSGGQHSANVRLQLKQGSGDVIDVDARVTEVQGVGRPSVCLVDLRDVTDEAQRAREMEKRESRLQQVFDSTSNGLLLADADGRPSMVNDAFCDIFELTPDEAFTVTIEELISESDLPRVRDYTESILNDAGSRPPSLIVETKPKSDGAIRTFLLQGRPFFNTGKVEWFLAEFTDITERIAAERQTAESESRFRGVFDSASSGLLILGTDGLPQSANATLLEIFGVTDEEMQERPPQSFVVSEQQAADIAECLEGHLAGTGGSCEHILGIRRQRDGAVRQVSVTCQSLKVGDELRGVLAEFTDLTETLAAQQALQDSERRLLEAERVAGLGHWEWDVASGTITASDELKELFGSGEDSALFYQRYMEMLAPEDRDRVRAASEAAFAGGPPFDQEYTVLPPDADRMIVHEVMGITFDDDGEPTSAVGTVQDVTKRVLAERARAESESRLRAIFDASHNGISFFSGPNSRPFRNRAFAEMLGYTSAEIEDMPLGALLPMGEDRSWIREIWERIGHGEPAVDLGLKHLVHKDGHIVDVDIRISGVEVDGNVVGQVADIRDITEELARRTALEESETRARLIFDSASSGLLLLRLNGEIQLANRAFCEMVGTTPEAVQTLSVHRIIDRRDVRPVFDLFRARLRGDEMTPRDVDVRVARLDDGRMRTLRVEARPFVEDGQIAGMLADVRDITEQVETRRALIESEDRLRRAQENARIGGWELDIATDTLRWSDELYRLFDLEPGSIEPTMGSLIQNTHVDDRQHFIDSLELAQQTGGPLDVRRRYTGEDGVARIIWSHGKLVRDGLGAPLRWEGTSQDITELAEAQDALSASEARLKAAQASAHIGSWTRDLPGGEVYWSDELYRLLGLEPGSIPASGETFRSFIHPEDRETYNEHAYDMGPEQRSYETQARFVGADDIERTLRVHGELTRDEQGQPLRWEGTVQDVTEQAAAQAALAESEARLNLAQSISHVGSWGRDFERATGYWSDEFFRLLGLAPGAIQASSANFIKYVHPDDRSQLEGIARSGVPSHDARVRVLAADGVERILQMHGELSRDSDGKLVRWNGTVQDVTELVRAQDDLATSTTRLELAQSQAHIGSFGRDLATNESYWSDELYRLLGLEPGSIEPSITNLYDAIQPDDRERFRAAVRAATETGSDRYDVRSRFVLPDGQERILWQYGELTRDDDGVPLRWDGTVQDVTELVEAQSALAEREEFLRTTLEAVRSGVMVVNPQRQIISANGNASSIMGYGADEFLDVRLEDVVHGEDLALMLGRFAARVRGEGGPERTIVRAQRKDGVEISLDVRGAPLMQSGELRGVVVDFRDVTEELAVQHRLEDTAKRLRTLFETVRSGLMVVGPDLIASTCNEALATVLGSSVNDVLGQSIDVFLLPEERQIVAEAIEARMRDEEIPGRIPSAIIRPDGTRREVDVRSTPFVVDGKPIGILCEVRDVTEELALQEEVQDTAERLNTVFETVSTGLIVVGLDQRPLTVNQALCEILGYSRDELMEKTFAELTHPDDLAFLMDGFAHRIAGGPPSNRLESRAIRRDGTIIHVDISAEPFRIGGEIVGVLGEVRDVTEALALQQEVENTAERLNTVFESVSTGLAIIGPDRRPVTVNQALSDMTGFSREELLSRSFEQGIHPDEVPFLLDRFADRVSGELDQRNDYQTRLIRRDGAIRDISVSSEPFHIGGQFVGVLAEIRDVTDELSLQRQVQETADRLNNVFESVSTGLLVIAPDRRPVTVNQALCDITGYSREQLLQSTFDELLHQDDLPTVLERFAQRLAGDAEPFHIQARTIRLDGETIMIDISAEPFSVGGEIVGVLAEIRDITEELELQERVQETADRLNNVFESVSTGLAIIGPDRVPQTMNQAFCEILGRTEEDLSSAPFDRLLHPDDLDLILERGEQRLRGDEVIPHHIHVRVIRSDGELVDIDLSAGPFVVAGKTIGLLAEIRDITEELSLQALVTESAEQINTILEATPDAIVVADDNDIILRVNAATEAIFGRPTEDLIGQPVAALVGGLDRAEHGNYVDHYRRTGQPSTAEGLVIGNFREATGRRADGSDFPAELAIAETELGDGRKLFVAAIRDITERKQAEAQLQQLNTELATRFRERQALVQQLLSAQEEERRSVAYEIHDGPAQQLAAAQMFLEAFAFDQNIDPDQPSSEHFQRAKSYLDTGLTETRRIMSGLRPALLDDLGLADALSQLLTELAERAGIQLELNSTGLTDELSPAIEITLYRIAQESASNAVKHSGTERLTVQLDSDGSLARLEVTDYGRGFNAATVQGPKDGRHYGLVGMRERVELLGGQFEIDSDEQRGTTIRATIPLNQERR